MAEYYKLDADLIVHTETEHYKISKGQYAIKEATGKLTGCTATTLNAAKTRVDADIVIRDAAIVVEEARLAEETRLAEEEAARLAEARLAAEEAAAEGTPVE